MLAEYAARQCPDMIRTSPMDGVKVYRLSAESAAKIPALLTSGQFGAFFCLSGTLTLTRTVGDTITLAMRNILLSSSAVSFSQATLSADFSSFLVTIDFSRATASLASFAAFTGFSFDSAIAAEHMQVYNGCATLSESMWSGAAFAALAALSEEEQERYAFLKALELFYLLSTRAYASDNSTKTHRNSTLSHTVRLVADYMRCHLDERLTIDILSTRFGISPTALKKEFRCLYAQPLHAWLMEQRLLYASHLLRESTLSVVDVAQRAGYNSASQFSNAFLKRFGSTPGQYRRISV